MSKKLGLFLCGIVGLATVITAVLLFKGVALRVSSFGEVFEVKMLEGKNYKNTLAKVTDMLEEGVPECKTLSRKIVIAFYLSLIGLATGVISVIITMSSGFQEHAEFSLIPLAFFTVAGVLYMLLVPEMEKAIAAEGGFLGTLLGITPSTDGTTIFWLNGILLIVATIIVSISKKQNASNNNYAKN